MYFLIKRVPFVLCEFNGQVKTGGEEGAINSFVGPALVVRLSVVVSLTCTSAYPSSLRVTKLGQPK